MNYGVFCLKNKYDALYCREIINGLVPCLLITNVPSNAKSSNIENYLLNANMGFNKFSYEHNCYQLLEQNMWPTDQPKFDKQIDYTQLVRQSGWQEEKVEILDQSKQRDKVRSIIEDLGNGETIELTFIPGGTFLMGSSSINKETQHTTTISPFHLGKYQVTQAQWRAVAKLPRINRDLEPKPSHFQGNNLPVEQVSWEDCIEFCNRLSLKTGRTYFLPSEAQWEYACRAGTTTDFYFGEYISKKLVNYNNKKTTSVGTLGTPNAFGLYDMHGNVWEWCADIPTNSRDNSVRVLRGGCWFVPSSDTCNSTSYYNRHLNEKNRCCGFRVVCINTTTNNQFSHSTSEQKQPKNKNTSIPYQPEYNLSKGSPKFKVKSEFVPTRCEICHQSDCFDAIQNRCSRCSFSSENNQPYPTQSRPTQIFSASNLLFAIGFCVVLLSLFFYQFYSSVGLENTSKTNLPQNTTLNIVTDQKVSTVNAPFSTEKEMSIEEIERLLDEPDEQNEQTTNSNTSAKDDLAELDNLINEQKEKEILAELDDLINEQKEKEISATQTNNYSTKSNNNSSTDNSSFTNSTTYDQTPQSFSTSPSMITTPVITPSALEMVYPKPTISTLSVTENGSYYGQYNKNDVPKTVHVNGYYRKNGTYVRSHSRSSPRR
jgi:formylglycine-generating enzyme required for sulfatase activity